MPEPVEAVVLEVPKEETAAWVERAADAGVTEVWIHMGRETPEALALAEEKGLNVRTGNRGVRRGLSASVTTWSQRTCGYSPARARESRR